MKTSGSFHLVQSQQEQDGSKQNTESSDFSNLDKTQGKEELRGRVRVFIKHCLFMPVFRECVLPSETRYRVKKMSFYFLVVLLIEYTNFYEFTVFCAALIEPIVYPIKGNQVIEFCGEMGIGLNVD